MKIEQMTPETIDKLKALAISWSISRTAIKKADYDLEKATQARADAIKAEETALEQLKCELVEIDPDQPSWLITLPSGNVADVQINNVRSAIRPAIQ